MKHQWIAGRYFQNSIQFFFVPKKHAKTFLPILNQLAEIFFEVWTIAPTGLWDCETITPPYFGYLELLSIVQSRKVWVPESINEHHCNTIDAYLQDNIQTPHFQHTSCKLNILDDRRSRAADEESIKLLYIGTHPSQQSFRRIQGIPNNIHDFSLLPLKL